MTHKVLKDFKGSPNGFTVIEFKVGDDFEHEGDLLEVALNEKWVEPIKAKEPKGNKDKDKNAAPAPATAPKPATPAADPSANTGADANQTGAN